MSDAIRLLIATHTHGSVTPAYCQSLATATAFLAAHGVLHAVMMFEDSLVDRGRDRAAATLLESDCTHLLFIDADIEFDPSAIIRLIAAGKDLVVGAYRKKSDRGEFAISFLEGADQHLEQCPVTGVVKIARAGTGFMIISRAVFERLAAEIPGISYKDHSSAADPRPMHAFFEHVVRDGRRWSEDYTFCERWRAIGGDIWLDPEINLSHWGGNPWKGSILDHIHSVDEAQSAAQEKIMKDIYGTVSPAVLIGAAALDADNTPVGVSIADFESALILISVGVGGITFTGTNKIEFKLTHSDDDSTYDAVAQRDVAGATVTAGGIVKSLVAAHAAADVTRVGYIGGRRYLKLLADFGGTHAAGTPISATVVRANPHLGPVA